MLDGAEGGHQVNSRKLVLLMLLAVILLAGCGLFPPKPPAAVVSPPQPGGPGNYPNLTDTQLSTLLSLEQIDDYPLYRMDYQAEYPYAKVPGFTTAGLEPVPIQWSCSLFASLGDQDGRLFGRNFDWGFSPALLLYTDPPEGYDSVSIVDIAYLGYEGQDAYNLVDHPLEDLLPLLHAPWIPFDGLNEMGLAIGMAAVPIAEMAKDQSKPTMGSVRIIREILDHAADVDGAIEIMDSYQIDFEGGPPIHYLIADRSGRAILIEYYLGEMQFLPNQDPWHLSTNFLVSAHNPDDGVCSRYDIIHQLMKDRQGNLSNAQALDLLKRVSQENTQWSVVYGMDSGEIQVVVGRDYNQVVSQKLEMREP